MTDEPVRTRVRTDDGWLDFQDYFVRLRQAPEIREVRYEGADASTITPEARAALQAAEAIVIAPSNPVVSIAPILAVPGMVQEISSARRRGVRAVGVSGIVGGKAVRGPADRMLSSLGEESSALGVARRYASVDLLDNFFIDRLDEQLTDPIRSLGLEVKVADTVMTDRAARARLAREMLA
jgi:LPPG:FO 2-phospho-L-lactate transferase